jgi:hypothetical protein
MAYFRCGQWITGALPQLCDGERAYESTEALRCIHYMEHYSLGVGPIGYYRALDLSRFVQRLIELVGAIYTPMSVPLDLFKFEEAI